MPPRRIDQLGERVGPGVPVFLPPLPAGAPANRLGFARWLVDPQNRLLARANRYRLDAEVIRDSALAAAGLLVQRIGGPSVKPYQPADLWKHITYDTKNTQYYDQSTGAGLVRRSLYTFWKRQIPPPTMQLLDAPSRETCVLRRQRTNTPLQALALLNDPQFVEAARELGRRMLDGGTCDEDRLQCGFRLVTARPPTDRELAEMLELRLQELHGQEIPPSVRGNQRLTGMTSNQKSLPLVSSRFRFAQHGQAGTWISELLPEVLG